MLKNGRRHIKLPSPTTSMKEKHQMYHYTLECNELVFIARFLLLKIRYQ